jgi:hypothetical protein
VALVAIAIVARDIDQLVRDPRKEPFTVTV